MPPEELQEIEIDYSEDLESIQKTLNEISEKLDTPNEPSNIEVNLDEAGFIELLQIANENVYWIIAFQVLIICLMLMLLFFVAMKAGHSR